MDAPIEYRTKKKLDSAARIAIAAGRAVSYTCKTLYERTHISSIVERIKTKSIEDKIE